MNKQIQQFALKSENINKELHKKRISKSKEKNEKT